MSASHQTVRCLVLLLLTATLSSCGPAVAEPGPQPSSTAVQQFERPRVTTQNPSTPVPRITPDATPASWARYSDDQFGISFEYPSTWEVNEVSYPDENYRALEVSEAAGGLIVIEKETNQERLTPRQWFEKNDGRRYHPGLVTELANIELRGDQVLIIGESKTEKSVPMVMAIISHDDAFFLAFQLERGSRTAAAELGRLLETLTFAGKGPTTTPIDPDDLKFPVPPTRAAGS